jgi:hypothetical protein
MESVNIPDGMPSLAYGAHSPGSGEACLLEYCSVIAGEEFTDHPNAVDPLLATLGRKANDYAYEQERALLLPLAARLLGTGRALDPGTYMKVGQAMRTVLQHYSGMYASYGESLEMLAMRADSFIIARSGSRADIAAGMRSLLTELLDAYDRATGRTVQELPESTLRMAHQTVLSMARA